MAKKKKTEGKGVDLRPKPDLLGPPAMTNAYYMCFNAAIFLKSRNLPWPLAKPEKKKKD